VWHTDWRSGRSHLSPGIAFEIRIYARPPGRAVTIVGGPISSAARSPSRAWYADFRLQRCRKGNSVQLQNSPTQVKAHWTLRTYARLALAVVMAFLAKGWPQLEQNWAPAGVFCPQFEQNPAALSRPRSAGASISAHTRAPTQPSRVHPSNRFSNRTGIRCFFFHASIVGKTYRGRRKTETASTPEMTLMSVTLSIYHLLVFRLNCPRSSWNGLEWAARCRKQVMEFIRHQNWGRAPDPWFLHDYHDEGAPSLRSLQGWERRTHTSRTWIWELTAYHPPFRTPRESMGHPL